MKKNKAQIILADDHQLVLDGLIRIVSSMPEVEILASVNSGDSVLEILALKQVDLVITDIEMPVMDGIALVKKLKPQYPEVKIMMVSMYHDPYLLRQLMQLGIDGFILKTDDEEEWKKGICTILDGKQYFSSKITQVLAGNSLKTDKDRNGIMLLTKRETEILELITLGLTNKQIGEKLYISHKTVDAHRTNLMDKLDIHNVAGLIRFALDHKLI